METKLLVNDLYNSSWFGSVLWDFYGSAATKIESCYNRTMKVMLGLPLATHRNLIEPVSGRRHLRRALLKRFLMMVERLRMTKKPVIQVLLCVTERNYLSITGSNLRGIMIESGRSSIDDLNPWIVEEIEYCPLPVEDRWIREAVTALLEALQTQTLSEDEEIWFNILCTE